jgi:transposase
MFVRPVLVMDQQAWTEAHVAAFAFFGGAPARLVPDNLRTGVDKPDLYDPKMNRSYAELASHYGVLVDPARAGKPKDKPRVAYCTSSGRWVGCSVCAGQRLGGRPILGRVGGLSGSIGW